MCVNKICVCNFRWESTQNCRPCLVIRSRCIGFLWQSFFLFFSFNSYQQKCLGTLTTICGSNECKPFACKNIDSLLTLDFLLANATREHKKNAALEKEKRMFWYTWYGRRIFLKLLSMGFITNRFSNFDFA